MLTLLEESCELCDGPCGEIAKGVEVENGGAAAGAGRVVDEPRGTACVVELVAARREGTEDIALRIIGEADRAYVSGRSVTRCDGSWAWTDLIRHQKKLWKDRP